jgi:hypothetical protein
MQDTQKYEIEVGDLVIRNDRLGPAMIVDEVVEEAGMVWLNLKCDGGQPVWPAALYVPA